MAFTRINLLGLPCDAGGSVQDILKTQSDAGGAQLVALFAPEAWSLAKQDPTYPEKLQRMSAALPDGHGVALACLLLTGHACWPFVFDMTGLAKTFFAEATKNKTPLILVGGQPRDDEDVREKLVKAFPDIQIIDTIHGYGEFEPKIAAIMGKSPQAVIVSMESPRQEEFMLALSGAGYRGLVIGAGSFIETYASDIDYQDYPEWMRPYHLAPLYKLYKEPKRLWRRYYFGYRYFLFLVAVESFKRARRLAETVAERLKNHYRSAAKN